MRKIILGFAALAAIATPIALASSADAATTDANGVVTVAKGEVMAQFPDMNEAAFQKIAMAAGAVAHRLQRVHRDHRHDCRLHRRQRPATLPHHHPDQPDRGHRDLNGSANKVIGWTLGAKGASVITENNTGGTRFPNFDDHLPRGHRPWTSPSTTSRRATAT